MLASVRDSFRVWLRTSDHDLAVGMLIAGLVLLCTALTFAF